MEENGRSQTWLFLFEQAPSGETKTETLLQRVETALYYPHSRLLFGVFEARLLMFMGVVVPLATLPLMESRNYCRSRSASV